MKSIEKLPALFVILLLSRIISKLKVKKCIVPKL